MADRKVTHTGKDEDGDITALCNPKAAWQRRSKAGAIRDIELGMHSYYAEVGLLPAQVVDIHVVNGATGKYLHTDPDGEGANNLDNLPDC